MARSLGLKVLELPTHPQTGIEIDALKKALEANKINLCLLVSNFSNPLGSLMPDEHKKEVVRLIQKYNIPLIEDDIYGDIYFGANRPSTCKGFDESGLVLWCSSISKTLAPGYRVGWLSPGKFKSEILRLKLFHSIASTSITQEVIANFLETGPMNIIYVNSEIFCIQIACNISGLLMIIFHKGQKSAAHREVWFYGLSLIKRLTLSNYMISLLKKGLV
ncbi:aminotransferase class I/II-fold pyridoxal phosphate-dependent enzyme [Pedobacter sp. NJ-S-72]